MISLLILIKLALVAFLMRAYRIIGNVLKLKKQRLMPTSISFVFKKYWEINNDRQQEEDMTLG